MSSFSLQEWSQEGGEPGRYCPGTPSDHLHSSRPPGQAWGTYVVCGCCRASTTARANSLMQIVLNLSSLYTLFYSVIYNCMIVIKTLMQKIVFAKIFNINCPNFCVRVVIYCTIQTRHFLATVQYLTPKYSTAKTHKDIAKSKRKTMVWLFFIFWIRSNIFSNFWDCRHSI